MWRHFLRLLVLVCAVLGASGCARELPIELVKVVSLMPRSVERGDRLEIAGSGFPQGRTARVALRGTLHRPGTSPESTAIVSEGLVVAPERIEILVDERFEALFCGSGADADHTTFTGELEVAFASRSPTAPPIGAMLHGVTLDMHPAVMDERRRSAEMESGKRTLAFLGIESATATASGLVVLGVHEGSRADTLGVSEGDVITSFGGLRVRDLRDLSASSSSPLLPMSFLRVSGREETRELSVVGLSSAAPSALSTSLTLLFALVVCLTLFLLPLRAPTVAAEARVSREVIRSLLPRSTTLYVPLIVAGLVLVATASRAQLAEELDVPLVVSAIFGLALLDGIERGASAGSLVRTTGSAFLHALGPALALATLGFASSGMGLLDASRAQGGLPWHWVMMKAPLALVALGVVVASRLANPVRRVTAFGALSVSLAAVGIVFLAMGGGAVSRIEASGSLVTGLVAAVKTLALAMTLLVLPRAGAVFSYRFHRWFAWKAPLLVAVLLLVLSVLTVRFGVPVVLRERTALGLLLGLLALGARIVARRAWVWRSPEPHADPFI
jgi:hypothetical protein